tara:strand:- start:701 stop:910 length:210 start_codon:yes stop_codon:yes gene_type:complete
MKIPKVNRVSTTEIQELTLEDVTVFVHRDTEGKITSAEIPSQIMGYLSDLMLEVMEDQLDEEDRDNGNS